MSNYSERKIKVFETHWGGGIIEVYDVDEYRAVINYSTGSSVAIYKKEDLPIEKVKPGWENMLWNYLRVPSLADGWWYLDETVDEAIDRNIDQIKNPDQRVWYEKLPESAPGTWVLNTRKIRYEHGLTEERIKEIEASPIFDRWYTEEKWFTELRKKYGP